MMIFIHLDRILIATIIFTERKRTREKKLVIFLISIIFLLFSLKKFQIRHLIIVLHKDGKKVRVTFFLYSLGLMTISCFFLLFNNRSNHAHLARLDNCYCCFFLLNFDTSKQIIRLNILRKKEK